ncbi:MAG: chemotaxis protein CheA, partial [Sphingomonadaceae bacterium]|nr:chemotaxis protein CheA [Sphingomonadaceae bacterium]
KPVELIDAHFLFAEVADERPARGERPICLLRDDGDRWTREVLRPMIELAGYEVVSGGEGGERAPDVVLDTRGGNADAATEGAPVVRLSDRQDGAGVYRYDRDGVLAALCAGAGRKA